MSGQQSKCTGLLLFQQAASSNQSDYPHYETRCYGTTSSIPSGRVVDLMQHDATRTLALDHPTAEVFRFNCVGSAVYQHGPNKPGGPTPPPFCLGVEYVRYSQALMHHRSQAAAHQPAHAMQQKNATDSISGPAPRNTVYHPAGPTRSSPVADSQPSVYTQQRSIPGSSSRSQEQLPASMDPDNTATELSTVARIKRTHQLVSERLEGKDPLWFAKAFNHRASLNVASMRRMVGELASAVASDLGLQEGDDVE